MEISVVIAAYNEEDNINPLYERLSSVLKKMKKDYEALFIDDGSTDKTYDRLLDIQKKDPRIRIIKFRKNFGQSAAWDAGFKHSKGKLIITMDADLQNDPKDIPKLVNELSKGYEVVSGWRYNRKDAFSKRLFSCFSRFLRRFVVDDKIHDSGCSLKIYKRECLQELNLHGEMHRYITEILALKGFKIGEIKVNHQPRKKGTTKYNLIRVPKGFLDLLVVAFWQKYSARPIHLFGGLGILMSSFGVLTGAYLVYIKLFYAASIANRPLLLLAVLLVVLGIQFVIFGLIADILVKLYYQGERQNYSIESTK
ncbi:glycosyltransferase family 2 protein [Candidatus Woesearchaeota archaeon]|nr:glycosyltransferase family 2 protein [Candidatus Woesearchaeota archaeon]